MREFTTVSLFCGAGGLDMGFERAADKIIIFIVNSLLWCK